MRLDARVIGRRWVLRQAGRGAIGFAVLTHKHPDHAGSISEVLQQASGASGYIGEADLAAVSAASLQPLADGDEVFGLQMIGTPGHTPGHLSVFDPDTALLLAGDALNNPGRLSGADPEFSEDMGTAADSVRKLARLAPRTILVGHGPPVTDGAAAALAELAESL